MAYWSTYPTCKHICLGLQLNLELDYPNYKRCTYSIKHQAYERLVSEFLDTVYTKFSTEVQRYPFLFIRRWSTLWWVDSWTSQSWYNKCRLIYLWCQSYSSSRLWMSRWLNYELFKVCARLPLGFWSFNDSRRSHRVTIWKKIFPVGYCWHHHCLSILWYFHGMFNPRIHGHYCWTYNFYRSFSRSRSFRRFLRNENSVGSCGIAWNTRWILPWVNNFRNLISDRKMAGSLGDDLFLDCLCGAGWIPLI